MVDIPFPPRARSMNKFATNWVVALRSGDYPQGSVGDLKSQSGYCCWGVACEISDEGSYQKVENGFHFVLNGEAPVTGHMCVPPFTSIVAPTGLTSLQSNVLMRLNDGSEPPAGYEERELYREVALYPGDRHTFEEIADVIEGWLS